MDARDRQVARETVRPKEECPACNPGVEKPLNADDFPATYKARMIAAYPVIAGLTPDEAWTAGQEEREVAFGRILRARNLRRTHELYLARPVP